MSSIMVTGPFVLWVGSRAGFKEITSFGFSFGFHFSPDNDLFMQGKMEEPTE